MPGGIFKWGSVNIQARNVMVEDLPRQAPRLGEGFAASSDRLDVRSYEVQSLHLGLGVHHATGEETDSKRYKVSEGLWAHQIGKLTLPPALTAQSGLQAVNASTWRDSNIGVQGVRSSLGGSTPLNYYRAGPYLFRENTSGVLSLAHTFTNNITWMGEVIANSTRYFAVVTDGTTDDALVTADPTAASISWSTWFALASGDRIDWFWSMREVGNGHTIMAGKLGSRTGYFQLAHSAALATAPSPAVNTGTRDIPGDLDVASVTAVPTTLVQEYVVDVSATSSRWRTAGTGDTAVPADVATADGVLYAEADPSSVSGQTTALRAMGFDLSAIWQYQSAIIKGIEYLTRVMETVTDGTQSVYDSTVYVYTLGQQSSAPNLALTNQGPSTDEWPTGAFASRTYGGPTMIHGRTWDVEDLKILQIDHSASISNTNASGRIDYMAAKVYYQMPGTQQSCFLGSEFIGADPVVAGRLWVIEPEADDSTGRAVPRRLVRVDVDYDAGGLRPSITATPQSNLPCFPYVLSGAIGEEALFLALGNNKDLAKHFLRIPFNTLVPDDIEWSRDQGFTEDWGINALFALGNDCLLQCALTNGTAVQDMLYEHHTDSVHFYGPRHTTTALPLRLPGQGRVSAASRFRHEFFALSDLTSSLVAYWPLNEASGNALDASGNGRTLTETSGTIGTAAGNNGNARDFESGDSEWFEAADNTWNSITGSMTIAAWIKLESVGREHMIASKWNINQQSYQFRVTSANRASFGAGSTGANQTNATDTVFGDLAADTWYFVVGRFDSGAGQVSISVNAGTPTTSSFAGPIWDGTEAFRIGDFGNNDLSTFDGLIQHVGLWSRALSDAEVTTLYNAGVGRAILGIEATRQYTPDTPHLDPFAALSAVTKQNGPLLITLPELHMMGPPEGRNALLTARLGSRQVSASKTIALYYSLDGGSTWTLWTTFTTYGATSTLSPPVKATTVALRVALNNAGASADTPGGLPISIFGDSDFQPRRRWTVELDETWLFQEQGGAGGVEALWDALQAVDSTLHLQSVTQDGADQGKAKWNRFRSGSIPAVQSTAPAQSLANPADVRHVLVFDEVGV